MTNVTAEVRKHPLSLYWDEDEEIRVNESVVWMLDRSKQADSLWYD